MAVPGGEFHMSTINIPITIGQAVDGLMPVTLVLIGIILALQAINFYQKKDYMTAGVFAVMVCIMIMLALFLSGIVNVVFAS